MTASAEVLRLAETSVYPPSLILSLVDKYDPSVILAAHRLVTPMYGLAETCAQLVAVTHAGTRPRRTLILAAGMNDAFRVARQQKLPNQAWRALTNPQQLAGFTTTKPGHVIVSSRVEGREELAHLLHAVETMAETGALEVR